MLLPTHRSQKVKLIDRKSALFRVSSPYMAVAGLFVTVAASTILGLTPGVHSEPSKVRNIIVGHWKPIFDTKSIDMISARGFMRHYIKHTRWNWNNTRPPDATTIRRVLKHPNNSASGYDGVCAAAWSFGGVFAEHTLIRLLHSQLHTRWVPENYKKRVNPMNADKWNKIISTMAKQKS